jgi:hypothetical protein
MPVGRVAGEILLHLIDIEDEGRLPSLTGAFERMSDAIASGLRNDAVLRDRPENFRLRGLMNKEAALDAWRNYRSVSHLWATYIGSQQSGGSQFDPSDYRNLQTFIGLSESYALRGCKIRLKTRPPQQALDIGTCWRFLLPGSWKPISLDPGPVIP